MEYIKNNILTENNKKLFKKKWPSIEKAAVYFAIIPKQIINCICFGYLIMNPKYIPQYLSGLLFIQTGLTCTFFYQQFYHIFENTEWSNNYGKTIETASKPCRDTIKKEIKIQKITAICSHLLTSGSTLIFSIYMGDEYDIYLSVKLNNDHTSGIVSFLGICYDLYAINMYAFYAVEWLVMFMKRNNQLKFQYMILNDMVENLKNEFNPELLYKNISACIQQHGNIIKLSELLLIGSSKFSFILMMFFLLTSCLQIASVYFIIAEISPQSNFRFFLGLMFAFYVSTACIHSGQELKNVHDKVFDTAYNTDWYQWERRSAKAIIMIIRQCAKPLEFSKFKLVDLDYTVVILIFRAVYAMLAVMMQMHQT